MKQIFTLILSLLSLKHVQSDNRYYDSYNGKNVGSSYNQTSNMQKVYAKTKILCLSICNELLSCQIVVYNQSNTQSYNCFLYENPLNFSADVVNSTGMTLFKKIFPSINESCLKLDCDSNSGLVCDNNFKCSCANDSYYWSIIQKACVYKCPTLEWIYNFSRCFIFTTKNFNWVISEDYCISIGAKLPILHSLAEEGFLYSFINSLNYSDRAPIPVNAMCNNPTMCTLKQYQWIDGRAIPYPDDSWWAPFEPNAGDMCVFYYFQLGCEYFGLHDYSCFDSNSVTKYITACETDIDTSR